MRTRAEIETEWRGRGGLKDHGTTLTLEVLLDIREMQFELQHPMIIVDTSRPPKPHDRTPT